MLPADHPEGQYDVEKILAWRQSRDSQIDREKRTAEDHEQNRELKAQRVRNLKIKNDKEEAEVMRRLGKLWDRELVLELMGVYAAQIKAAVKTLRRRGHINEARTVEEYIEKAKKQGNAIIDRAIRESKK